MGIEEVGAGVDNSSSHKKTPVGFNFMKANRRFLRFRTRSNPDSGPVLRWHVVAVSLDAVLFIDENEIRLPARLQFRLIDQRKRRNDHQVAQLRAARRRSIQRNHPAAALALDGVSRQALAVIHVPDVDLLVFKQIRGFQQVLVDGARAFVMQFAMRDRGAVNLRFQKRSLHASLAQTSRLSIKRVVPSLAAASTTSGVAVSAGLGGNRSTRLLTAT